MANPPKTSTSTLPDYARNEEGVDRVCDTCGENKTVNRQSYAIKRAGLRGYATTCRVCQGREAGQRRLDGSGKEATEAKKAKKVEKAEKARIRDLIKLPSPKPLSGYIHAIDQLVDEMYELSGLGKLTAPQRHRLDLIIDTLSAAIRLPDDPAGYGMAVDEDTALRTFLRALRPLVPGFVELGTVHDQIIDGLLSQERNVVILASRGVAKSTLTAQFVCWRLLRDHYESVLLVSKSGRHADKMLRSIKGYIAGCPLLETIRPNEECLNSATQLEIGPAQGQLGMSVSVSSYGLTGQVTGSRASLIIADDVETKENSATPEQVEKLEDQLSELTHVAIPGAEIKYLGTPHSVFSVYGRFKRNPEYKIFTGCVFVEDTVDGKAEIDTLWGNRFTTADLLTRKKSIPKMAWELQYRLRLDETMQVERPLQLKELMVLDWPPAATVLPIGILPTDNRLDGFHMGAADPTSDYWREAIPNGERTAPATMTTMAVDPAGGLAGRGDAIGVAVLSVTTGGKAVIRHLEGVRAGTTNAAIGRVASIGMEFQINGLVVEENVNGLFTQQLGAVMATRGYPIVGEKITTGQIKKGTRIIQTLAPVLGTERLFILKEALESEGGRELVNQFTSASYDGRIGVKYDDILDALSHAVAAVSPALQMDEGDALAASMINLDHLVDQPLRRGGITHEEYENWTEVDHSHEARKERLRHLLEVQRCEIAIGYNDPRLQTTIEALNKQIQTYKRLQYAAPRDDIAPMPYLPR
jgi:hypothetical protein